MGLYPCAASSAYALISAMATEDIRNRKIAPSITFKFLVQQLVFGCKDCASRTKKAARAESSLLELCRVAFEVDECQRNGTCSNCRGVASSRVCKIYFASANIQQGVSQNSGTPSKTLISFKSFGDFLLHFFTYVNRFKYFNAISELQQLAHEVRRGSHLEAEVSVAVARR